MEATNKYYDFSKSLERIDEILNADNKQYEEKTLYQHEVNSPLPMVFM